MTRVTAPAQAPAAVRSLTRPHIILAAAAEQIRAQPGPGLLRDGASDVIANPASCLVAGAGYTEYYTVPETYWIELR
jgi:hypothetical protein